MLLFQTEKVSPGNFLNPLPFTHCVNLKFVVCLFFYEEAQGSEPFANKLNGLYGLAHLYYSTEIN
jgi:hypothetical protein